MEITTMTISFAKGKAQTVRKRETVIKEQLDELDKKKSEIARILIILILSLNNLMTLKRNSNNTMTINVKLRSSGQNADQGRRRRESYKVLL